MRNLTADDLDQWLQGAALLSLAALAWTILVPDDVIWTVVVAGGVIACAVAAAVLGRPKASPSLAQAIARQGILSVQPPPPVSRGGETACLSRREPRS